MVGKDTRERWVATRGWEQEQCFVVIQGRMATEKYQQSMLKHAIFLCAIQ